jgi:hypothetical protein
VALTIRHIVPDAQFKVTGLAIIAGMVAARFGVTTLLARRRRKAG